MWARKIWIWNEFLKRSKQTIYTAIVWKIFMHWTIVHMFRLSYCGVRIRLKEYSYVNIRFVNRIHYLRLLFSSSLKLSDFGEFRKIDYIRWRQISFLLFFGMSFTQIAQTLHEFAKIKYPLNLFLRICLNYVAVKLANLRYAIKQEWLELMLSTTSFLQQFLHRIMHSVILESCRTI